MQHVLIIDNPLDRASWEEVQLPLIDGSRVHHDVRSLLAERYTQFPASGRIYANAAAVSNDVTPRTPADVARLAEYDKLVVVIYPQDPVTLIIAAVVAVVVALSTFLLLPKIDASNVQTTSPNNGLSERSNRARPGARIPDIFGQVRSIPDLIARPYRVYDNHRQLEIAYMCVGRGAYDIPEESIRDGDTPIADILGASAAVYGPFHSPNEGLSPDIQIGTAIGDPVFSVTRLNDVNGQTLKAPNDEAVRADQEIQFQDGGIIKAGPGIDFTDFFEADDEIELGNATGGDQTAPTSIFADATASWISSGVYGKFVFTTIDPTDSFSVGERVRISQAVWTTTTGGGSGGVPGGGGGGGGPDNPDYPDDQFPTLPTFISD